MSADTSAIDEAVAAYRARMRDAGDVRTASLDEIEDHLRELIAELRASGLPLAALAGAAAAVIAWRTGRKRFNSNLWRTA